MSSFDPSQFMKNAHEVSEIVKFTWLVLDKDENEAELDLQVQVAWTSAGPDQWELSNWDVQVKLTGLNVYQTVPALEPLFQTELFENYLLENYPTPDLKI